MIYIIRPELMNVCKIGRAANPIERLASLQIANYKQLWIAALLPEHRIEIEWIIQKHFPSQHIRGEWYKEADNIIGYLFDMNGQVGRFYGPGQPLFWDLNTKLAFNILAYGDNRVTKQRISKSWLTDYLKFVENSESPISYHRWSAISLLAGALQRRVFMKRGHSVIYPNMYIVLVGPSGLSRKGEPIQIARTFLEQLNVAIIPEDNSKESIARDMHDFQNNFTDRTTGKIMTQAAVTCFSEEMAVFCGYQNIGLLSHMTNWYDSRDKWERRTKNQGIDEVNGVCFNFLTATDPSWLPGILPKEAVGGGFTSRVVFVVEDRKRRTIANPDEFPADEQLRAKLLSDLEVIMTLTGCMRFNKEAQKIHDEWYNREDELVQAGKHPISDPYLRGYLARRETHLRKLCMCISAARDNNLTVLAEDINWAIDMLEAIEPKMHEVFKGMGTTKYAAETQFVLELIRNRRSATKAEVMNQFPRTIDSLVYDAVVEDLAARKLIKVFLSPDRIQFIGQESRAESEHD